MGQKWVLLFAAAVALIAVGVSCGHERTHAPSPPVIDSNASGQALQDILRDIDAYPAPKGVSAETWSMLKAELKRLLVERERRGEAVPRPRATHRVAPTIEPTVVAGKSISIAPTGSQNAVSGLAAVSNAAGTQATVSWTELLPGDYNNDGAVDIIDLQPVALYYGQSTDSGPNDGHKLVVGDSDPVIGIGDLQAIANNYAAHLQGYQVWRGHWNGTSTDWEATPRPNPNAANPDWSADRPSPPPVSSRPTYVYLDDLTGVTDTANVRYKVASYGDGAAGAVSNEATMTVNPLANSPWPKFRGNAQNTGLSPYVGPQTNHVKWTYATGGIVKSSPSIGPDGTVYIGCDDGYLYALNPSDGSLKWRKQSAGGYSCPAVGADGTVYVGSFDGNLYALSPLDGSAKWQVTLTSTSVDSSPTIGADGTIYVGSDSNFYGPETFFAVNPSNGSFKWKRTLGIDTISSPALGLDGTIYVGSDDHSVYALNPSDGTTKWAFTTGDGVGSSPVVGEDGTVYVGGYDSNVYALNASDGSLKWKYTTGAYVHSSPALGADGTLFVGCGDYKVYALRAADGSLIWTFTGWAEGDTSPAIGADGTVYAGAGDLYALNPADGSLKWDLFVDYISSSPAIGSDGTVYVGGGMGDTVVAIGQ